MSSNSSFKYISNLKNDLPAGLVVFLVAVPLCLGIALASGAPLFSGIISGIVGGLIVTLISKSELGVSGPAAGLAVIVLNSIQELEQFQTFLMAVFLAGLIQILLGVLKTGVIGYYFPSSVIKGMLSGIGLILILKQIPHAFGYDQDPEGDMEFFQADGHNTFSELSYMLDSITPGALLISVLSLLILILWERPFMKKLSFTRVIQGPLVAVLLGIGLNLFYATNDLFSLKGEHVVDIPVTDSITEFFGQFTFPDFSQIFNGDVWFFAITIAIVASLETLLCVEATDKLDPERKVTPTNRELLAQGVGNSVSGLIGGLPITQVIVRSSANIQSGGKTKVSAFFHGLLLLVSAMFIPGFLNLIPLASLAAILIVVGYKLINPKIFKDMYKTGRSQFVAYVVTILGIIFTDLLIGIGLGLAVAFVFILYNNFKTAYHFDPEEVEEGKPIRIELSEDLSFLNKANLIQTFALIPPDSHVIIDGRRNRSIHWDALEVIEDFKINAESRNIKLEIIGLEQRSADSNSLEALQRHVKERS